MQLLADTAAAWKLDKAWTIKPMLDGKALQQATGLKPSPQFGTLLKAMLEWQFVHPDATVEDCRAWIIERQSSLSP